MSGRSSIHLIGSRLRQIRARKLIAMTLAGVSLIALAMLARPSPILVWNASASAPVGLYRVDFAVPERGDLVLVRPPEAVAELAARRGYLVRNVPLVKHIAASRGEHVCAFKEAIIIRGAIVARRLKADSSGRPLPWWNGCRKLSGDETFLLGGGAPGSFDSRYFGPVPARNIIGRLVPIWTE